MISASERPAAGAPDIAHFILTRFCLRYSRHTDDVVDGPTMERIDPLERSYLRRRLDLLETLAAPSVHGQSVRTFKWVVLIDPNIDEDIRLRLLEIERAVPQLVVTESRMPVAVTEGGWLDDLMDRRPAYLLTTNLDDDDALDRHYVSRLQRRCAECVAEDPSLPLRLFGTTHVTTWNMTYSRSRPLGTRSTWTRAPVPSLGFSLLVARQFLPVTVLSLNHRYATSYLDIGDPPPAAEVESFQRLVVAAARSRGVDLTTTVIGTGFDDVGEATSPGVVANHRENVSQRGASQRLEGVDPVVGPQTFPGVDLGWDRAPEVVRSLRVTQMRRLAYRLGKRSTTTRVRIANAFDSRWRSQ